MEESQVEGVVRKAVDEAADGGKQRQLSHCDESAGACGRSPDSDCDRVDEANALFETRCILRQDAQV